MSVSKKATQLTDSVAGATTAVKKAKGLVTVYISRQTKRPVTEGWAKRNPDKVTETYVTLAELEAAKKAKKTPLQQAQAQLKKAQRKVAKTGKALKKAIAAEKAGKRKTSRVVKRDRSTGEFAAKTSRKRSVTNDIVKAPTTARKALATSLDKKSAKKSAKVVKKALKKSGKTGG